MNHQKNNQGDPLRTFVSRLVKEKGLINLDREVLEQIKNDLLERVENRVNAAILVNIPPEKLEYFEKLLDHSDRKEIQAFCQRNIPNMDTVVAAELMGFRDTYLGLNE